MKKLLRSINHWLAKAITLFVLLFLVLIDLKSQPVIIGQPADTAVCNGGKAVFNVLAINANAYQWQENDGVGWYNIDASITYATGYTTQLLSINDANLGLDGYRYRCLVFDGQNNTSTSNAATLGVNEPPVITLHPQDITVCKNDIASFSVNVLNADKFQWQESVGQGWINLTDNAFYTGTSSQQLQIFTTTGMNGFRYRCRVINGNCPDTTASAFLFVNPTPTLQEVIGGGAYCEGGQGVGIALAGSETGISYQLQRNGAGTGIVISGTGESINFGMFTQAGTYSVLAINGATSCEIPMINSVNITVNPLPLQQQILGGGSFCAEADAPEIFLASTQQNIEYILYRNGISTGKTIIGNGFTNTFGTIDETGFYTVSATNISSGCSIQLSGNVQVMRNNLPIVEAGLDQTISMGESTQLNATAEAGSGNYLFSWQPSAFLTQPQQATTSTVALYQTTLFKVTAKDQASSCQSIADSVMIIVSGGPLNSSILASQSILCKGEQTTLIASASGGTGIYTYSWTSIPTGFNSNSPEITVSPEQNTTYQLSVNDGNENHSSSITITVKQLPTTYNLIGGGSYCEGSNGPEISLTGSQIGTLYQLKRDEVVLATKDGNGQAIIFGTYNIPGIYTSKAINIESGCSNTMDGSNMVSIQERPIASAGNNITIEVGESTTLQGSATAGSGNYAFSWTPANKLINPNSAIAATIPLDATQLFRLTVTDQSTSCTSTPSEVVVFVSGGNTMSVSVSASAYNVCPETEIQLTVLASGGTGNYSYSWTSVPQGFTSNVYNPVADPQQTTKYIVTVNDGLTQRTDSILIQLRPLPVPYNITGGGSYCEGGNGVGIGLSGTQPSTIYSLFRNGIEMGVMRSGNGDSIHFGRYQDEGIYQIRALSLTSLCSTMMNGTAAVEILSLPIVETDPDQMILPGQTASLRGYANGGSGNYSFQWEPANLVINPQAAQTNTTPLLSGQDFLFTAIDNQSSCASLAAVSSVIVQGSMLEVHVSASDAVVCEGSSVQLFANPSGGSGNFSYSWSSVPAGFYSTERNPIVFPETNTNFVLQVNDGITIVSDEINIGFSPLPEVFNLTGGGNICHTGATAAVGLDGSQVGNRYHLFHNGTLIAEITGSGNAFSFGLFNETGTYTATGQNISSSCATTMAGTSVILSGGEVIAHAGPDKYLNQPGQTTLEGNVFQQNTPYTFNWHPANKLLNPESLQPSTVHLVQPTLYRLQAVPVSSGCPPSEDYAAVLVGNAINPLQVQIFSSDTSICPGNQIQLFALVSGGSGNYTYNWTSSPAGFTSDVFNPIVSPTENTTYIVSIIDGDLVAVADFELTVHELPEQFQISGGGAFCEGQSLATIDLNSSETSVIYRLLRNNLLTNYQLSGTGQNLTFAQISQNGVYTIEAFRAGENCVSTMLGQAEVIVHPTPLALSAPDQSIPRGSSTMLQGTASGGSENYSYQWIPAAFVANPHAANTLTMPLEQSVIFQFVATDINSGCASKADSTLVTVTGGIFSVSIIANQTEVCPGTSIELVGLAEGGSGNVNFTWKNEDGVVIGNENTLNYEIFSSTTVFLEAQDGSQTAETSILIETIPFPEIFNFEGGGSSCSNNESFSFSLSGSQVGVTYYLYNNDNLMLIKEGTGQAMLFGQSAIAGNYFIKATFSESDCFVAMNGVASIDILEKPFLTMGAMQSIPYGSSAQLEVAVSGGSGNYIYQWQPETLLLAPNQQQTASIPLMNSTLFAVMVQDIISGCSSNGQTTVFVGPQPNDLSVQLFSPDENICPFDRVRLFAIPSGGSGSYSYTWTSDPPGFVSNLSDPEDYPGITTTYSVVVSDGVQSAEANITIYVKPSPHQFVLFGGGAYCSGNQYANVILDGSEHGTVYTLYRNGFPTDFISIGTGAALQFGPLVQSGLYTVIARHPSTNCALEMIGEADVQIYEPPVVLAGPDQLIESGQQTTLSAVVVGGTGSYTFQWQPSSLVTHPDSMQTNTFALQQSTVFLFTATDAVSFCQSNADTTIIIVTGGQLQTTIVASANKICAGQTVVFTAIPQGGSGNYSYLWTDNDGNILGSNSTLILSPSFSTVVNLAVEDGIQAATASKNIEVGLYPETFSITGGGSFCGQNEGVSIGLSSSESNINYNLIRNFSQQIAQFEGSGSALDFGLHNISGVYTVQAVNSEFGCTTNMAGSALVQQVQPPLVDAGPQQSIPFGGTAQLISTVSGGSGNYSYNWLPAASLINPQIANPTTISLTQSTGFSLQVTDVTSGCSSGDQTIVFVSGGTLTLSIEADNTLICNGNTATLTGIPQGGTGNYSWTWKNQNNQNIGNTASIQVNPAVTSIYYLTIADGIETTTDSITIQIASNAISFNIEGGGSWCSGTSAPAIGLSGSQQGYSYRLFRNGNGTSFITQGTGNALTFEGTFADGTYAIAAIGPNGCTTMMQGNVVLQKLPLPLEFTVLGGGTYCSNEPLPGVYMSNSQTGVIYKLIRNLETTVATKEGTGGPITFESIEESGIYTIEASQSVSDCSIQMSGAAIYIINPIPTLSFTGPDFICFGDSAVISLSGASTYLWLTTPPVEGSELVVHPTEDTDFKVLATNMYQCSTLDTFSISVAPIPAFNLINEPVQRIIRAENLENVDFFQFSSGGLLLQQGPSSIFNYSSISFGSDSLQVIAFSPFGCETTAYIQPSESGKRINAFSPNSDQINDRFMRGSFIRLYSRWGLEIYSGDEGWDGKYKGMEVAPGTYYYIHEIKDPLGNLVRTEKGSVTLVKE